MIDRLCRAATQGIQDVRMRNNNSPAFGKLIQGEGVTLHNT